MADLIDMTPQLSLWADALRAIAQTGLAFDPNAYDRERYQEMLQLAAEMAGTINGRAALDPTLAAQLETHWRAQVRSGPQGYVTPKVGVGAIVFNQRDELLLIQRPDTQHWLYPTGWLDVGYSPAQTAVKEVEEETGLLVEADRLLGVFDSHLRNYPMAFHMVSVMIYCRLVGGELRRHPLETMDAGFFPRDQLPTPLHLEGGWVGDVFRFHHGRREPILE
jgi:ADP-ribose pyrophosphatase YjhB (NUDIX family)